jgi:hypothetical protein
MAEQRGMWKNLSIWRIALDSAILHLGYSLYGLSLGLDALRIEK